MEADASNPARFTRDQMTRCKVCKQLFKDVDAVLDGIKGLQCPNGCEETFEQPPYESPLLFDHG